MGYEGKRIKVYKAKDGWRWQKWVSSDITAESGEAYSDKTAAVEAANKEAEDSGITVVQVNDMEEKDA